MATPSCTRCNRPLKNPASVLNGTGPVCAARAARRGSVGAAATRSSWSVFRSDPIDRRVWIRDNDVGLSVTNDAEAVVAALEADYPGWRFFYRDTDGAWDELQHDGSRFTGFAPARDLALSEGLS